MELGDKTQLATIALGARFSSPVLVFMGMGSAFLLITVIAVIIGAKLKNLLPERYIRIGSSIVFLAFGIITLLNATLEISIV
ncbi:MAG: TMEM165/GDT1 family protein [Candidatus Hadarchaeota archaeon]